MARADGFAHGSLPGNGPVPRFCRGEVGEKQAFLNSRGHGGVRIEGSEVRGRLGGARGDI